MFLTVQSCAQFIDKEERITNAKDIAGAVGWADNIIEGEYYDLLFYSQRLSGSHNQLVIYIEGDGLAWLNKNTPSSNPTPINPIALKLALKHAASNVVYLARPCQYVGGDNQHNCHQAVWTHGRFSEPVVQATNAAINQLKLKYQAHSLTLVGYSGGGAVAALVAARRSDVSLLVTVAGNLDHQAWTQLHDISPLNQSLNPIDYREQLALIPQIHFVAEGDKVVPPKLTQQFVAGFEAAAPVRMEIIPDFDHHCCWPEYWKDLLLKYQVVGSGSE